MVCLVNDTPIYYKEFGQGKPILHIHGWGPDHRMMVGAYEPIYEEKQDYRRIYLDLPGFGKTPLPPSMQNSDDMLDIVCGFVDNLIGKENFLLAGCSYGGYIAMGLLCKMGERIDGVLLDVPDVSNIMHNLDSLPKRKMIWKSKLLDSQEVDHSLEGYLSMAVIATPEMLDKWKTQIQPGLDVRKLGRYSDLDFGYSKDMEEAIKKATFDKPACILTGKQDHATGYTQAYHLLDRFSRATYVVLDGAGHLLYMEREAVFVQMVLDWLCRVELNLENKG